MEQTIRTEADKQLVPAVCTQCGAQLEVDPTQEAAVCKYCGTPFIVQKAVNNYNIQHATIEHADNVTIEMKSKTESVLDFMGKQLSESREVRREERKASRELEKTMFTTFFKIFGIIAVLSLICYFVALAFGFFDGAPEPEKTEQAAFFIESSVPDLYPCDQNGPQFDFDVS